MSKTVPFFILAILFLNSSYGQIGELTLYKNIYSTADSLIKIGQIKYIDSTIFETAAQLDKGHPAVFFNKAGELLSESKFNEASFIYYLGLMRYRYYNSVNPDYKASGDGALLGSMQYVIGEPINMYLKTDIDNFISIITTTIKYYDTNDFTFYSKKTNEEKFKLLSVSYNKLVLDLKTNREKYMTEWGEDKNRMKKLIDLWTKEALKHKEIQNENDNHRE